MKIKSVLLLSILLLSILPTFVHGAVVTRGSNYIITSYSNGHYSWQSAPQWIQSDKIYVPYIYSFDSKEKSYTIQSGLIGAKIYETYASFFTPDLKTQSVKSEIWSLEYFDGLSWKAATLNKPTFSTNESASSIIITRTQTTTKPSGILTIKYEFNEGQPLKHTIKWTASESAIVRVNQLWDISDGIKKVSEDYALYTFTDSIGKPILYEDQRAMVYTSKLEKISTQNLTAASFDMVTKKSTFTFGQWNLLSGQSLTIDPNTFTASDPTINLYVSKHSATGNYARVSTPINDGLYMEQWTSGSRHGYVSFVEWDITSISDVATITKMEFRYEGLANTASSSQGQVRSLSGRYSDYANDNTGNGNLYAAGLAGTLFYGDDTFPVVGASKSVELNADGRSDLMGKLAGDWYDLSLVIEQDGSLDYKAIKDESVGGVNPKPTLYVEYDVIVTSAVSSITTTTTTSASTTGTTTISPYTSTIKTTITGGTSTIHETYSTNTGSNGTTYFISHTFIISSTVSYILTYTDPVAGTLTGYETTTTTTTDIIISSTSTTTTDISTTETSTSTTDTTISHFTSTSIIGVIGGGTFPWWLIPLIVGGGFILVVLLKRRKH